MAASPANLRVEGEGLIDSTTTIRPTRNRLYTAMGLSACIVALLLASFGLLIELVVSDSRINSDNNEPLTVRIEKGEFEREPDSTTNDESRPAVPLEPGTRAEDFADQLEVVSDDPSEPPTKPQPTRDWHAIGNQVAKATVDEYFRQEESRETLWRESRSVMFEPGNEMVLKSEAPVIADLRFKPQIHVLGLGITIGSCFFGVPIAGVPVEQRNVAITLFVCANGS